MTNDSADVTSSGRLFQVVKTSDQKDVRASSPVTYFLTRCHMTSL